MRTYISDITKKEGEEVELMGWVAGRRDHGKLIFLDIRDKTGLVQAVALPNHKEAHVAADTLRSEWVVKIRGKVNKRPDNMVNKDLLTGAHEIEILDLDIFSESETPPFDLLGDGLEIGEEHRMKYRYLDLRRPRLVKNLKMRSQVTFWIRQFLHKQGFYEIETPILTKSTPEGARDYLVPSRLDPGRFYALPQSPQQYKQLLMLAGFEKYFQIARCFRDEDTRGDRQPEFTQLDMEMSFVDREAVMNLTETMLINIIQELYPEKHIQETPFPRLTYKEAMDKYGTDRPDLRSDKSDVNLMAFCWVIDFPFFEKDDKGNWTFTHNPFSAVMPEYVDNLLNKKDIGSILTSQYDVVLNGFEIGGGSLRAHRPAELKTVLEIMNFNEDRIQENYGHMLKAFKYGAPPHGGIAWGFDRLMMIFEGENSIREVMAFPKTGDGRDLMMQAPSSVSDDQLNELSLKIKNSAKT